MLDRLSRRSEQIVMLTGLRGGSYSLNPDPEGPDNNKDVLVANAGG